MVDLEDGDAQRHALPARSRHFQLQDAVQRPAVGETGQRVGMGDPVEPLRPLRTERQRKSPFHRHCRQIRQRLRLGQRLACRQRPGESQAHHAERNLDAFSPDDEW